MVRKWKENGVELEDGGGILEEGGGGIGLGTWGWGWVDWEAGS